MTKTTPTPNSNISKYKIDVLDKAVDILELLLNSEKDLLNTSEIARSLGINRGRAFRILKTFEARNLIEFVPDRRGYRLGIRFLELGEKVRDQLNLLQEAEPLLLELARKTGDSTHLLVPLAQAAMCIARYQGGHTLQVASPVGVPIPLHVGAAPKLFLAYLPESERESMIRSMELTKLTPYTITDREDLRQALTLIREQKYSIDEMDYDDGVYAVAAPVRDHKGVIIAAVTTSTPEIRWNPNHKRKLIEMTIRAATQISVRIGYSPVASN